MRQRSLLAAFALAAACGTDAGMASDASPAVDAGTPGDLCMGLLRPTARDAHTLVAVSATSALLFGGDEAPFDPTGMQQSVYSDELWRWDLGCGAWTRLSPKDASAARPSARGGHAAVFDGKRNRMIVLFGRSVSGGGYLLDGDVWAWDVAASAWTQLAPTGSAPAARQSHRAVYDPQGDRVILFGGNAGTLFGDAPLDDTWSLDFSSSSDGAWKPLATTGSSPSKRQDVSLALDEKRGLVVLFGGAQDFVTYRNDVWTLSLASGAWSQSATSGTKPSARFRTEMVRDVARDRLVLFGGHDAGAQGLRNDTWALAFTATDGSTGGFTSLLAGDGGLDVSSVDHSSPERRDKGGLVLDGSGRAWLAAGISDCGPLDDAWRLDLASATWSTVWPAQVGETCYRRATGAQQCSDECSTPM